VEQNGGIDRRYLDRGAFITLGALATSPARFIFKLRYQSKIDHYNMSHSPVIIIGHWRSGTSFLHELLSQDPQFCYVSLWNTMLPDSYPLVSPWKEYLSQFLPQTRPMDNIEVNINGPYEEEAGIAVLSPYSFFHGLHFPKNAEEQYVKSIHFKDITPKEKDQWKQMYQTFMKSVAYTNDDKRLLLKDPANTARIPMLLDIFPDAKFIHIYRNPFKVYLSTIKMRNKVLDKLALQDGDSKIIEKQVIQNYKRLMKEYFKQRELIPEKNLIEIQYEELVKHPLKLVHDIYDTLELPHLDEALPGMKDYLEAKKNYKTNVYKIDDRIIQKVKKHWGFTIDLWGYSPP